MRPYHPAYLPFKWRGWWDFGTGALGDIGCHAMDPVFRALKLGAPVSVQAASTRVNEETYPLASMVTYQFPARPAAPQAINCHVQGLTGAAAGGISMPPCRLVWYDGGLRPPRREGLPDGKLMGDNGHLLVGDKGFLLGNTVYRESRAQERDEVGKTIPRSEGHYREWLAACKGGKPAGSNFDWAGPLAHQGVEHFKELTYPERKAIHNLKYYTWVEQQGKTSQELSAQWEPDYWRRLFEEEVGYFDQLIEAFNATGGRSA